MKRNIVISFLILYSILFISKKLELHFPELINSYLSDLLCIPIVLSIARYGVAYWINDAHFQLNRWHMAFACLAFIGVFELALPSYNSVYTSDTFDALMYIIGTIIFDRFQTPSLISSRKLDPIEF